MHIEITKIELSSRIFLKWEYTMTDNGRVTKIKAKADAPVHEDLQNAIQSLVPHFVLVSEMKKKPDVVNAIDLNELPETLISKYRVTGLSINDDKGDISYKISGFKILNTGRTISFETPSIREMENEDERYEFISELITTVDHIKDEVLEFMDGKEAEKVQTSMDFDDDFNPEGDDVPEEEFTETAA